jgi:hypothetical protein
MSEKVEAGVDTRENLGIPCHYALQGNPPQQYWMELRYGEGPDLPTRKDLTFPDRRVIYIPAVPTSGTSSVAGILHMLGVDMGNIALEHSAQRDYATFEDLDFNFFKFEPNGQENRLIRMDARFRDYLNYRLHKEKNGRVGVKVPPTYWMSDHDPLSLPLDILDVRRPVEDSIISDMKKILHEPTVNKDAADKSPPYYCHRAGGMAYAWLSKLMLYEMHPPKLSIHFYELLEDPAGHIEKIIEAFDLEPTDEQIKVATMFVRPEKRSM